VKIKPKVEDLEFWRSEIKREERWLSIISWTAVGLLVVGILGLCWLWTAWIVK
jgi:hypothetical protein